MFNYFLDLNDDFKSRLGIDLQCGVPCLVRLLCSSQWPPVPLGEHYSERRIQLYFAAPPPAQG